MSRTEHLFHPGRGLRLAAHVLAAVLLRTFVMLLGMIMLPVPRSHRVTFLSREHDGVSLDFSLVIQRLRALDPTLRIRVRAGMITHTLPGRIGYLARLIGDAYAVARSRVVVTDGYSPVLCLARRSPGLEVVQFWHALGALKKFGRSAVGTAEGAHPVIARVLRQHTGYDRVLISSALAAEGFLSAFDVPEAALVTAALPRIDYLRDPAARERARAHLAAAHPRSVGKTVVLFAPTLRTSAPTRGRAAENALAGLDVSAYFPITSSHPVVSHGAPFSTQELILAADVFVTDYSSTLYEAAVVGLPIHLYAPDLEAFSSARGFYGDYTELGFPVAADPQQLARDIDTGTSGTTAAQEFAARWVQEPASGSAAQDLAESILTWCEPEIPE